MHHLCVSVGRLSLEGVVVFVLAITRVIIVKTLLRTENRGSALAVSYSLT